MPEAPSGVKGSKNLSLHWCWRTIYCHVYGSITIYCNSVIFIYIIEKYRGYSISAGRTGGIFYTSIVGPTNTIIGFSGVTLMLLLFEAKLKSSE